MACGRLRWRKATEPPKNHFKVKAEGSAGACQGSSRRQENQLGQANALGSSKKWQPIPGHPYLWRPLHSSVRKVENGLSGSQGVGCNDTVGREAVPA